MLVTEPIESQVQVHDTFNILGQEVLQNLNELISL